MDGIVNVNRLLSQIISGGTHFCAAVTFLSRLPACRPGARPVNLAKALSFAPLAGVLIVSVPLAVLALADLTGLPGLVAATLTIAALILTTGALHEDGLSDVADGFGGGSTPERKLAIMRDSRIGTFGAAALGCSILLRSACLTQLLERGGLGMAIPALLSAASLSRALMLIPLVVLPPARVDGLAAKVGRLPWATLAGALSLAILVVVATIATTGLSAPRSTGAAGVALAACIGVTLLARRQIGGVTGDVAGACQQLSEIAILVVLSGRGTGQV